MKKLSQKTLNRSFWRWYYGNLTGFTQEHMQTFGYMWSMLPIIQELYDKKEDQCKALQTYYPFFNTEPQIGTIVVGITAGLEEARANGAEEIDDEMINGIRAGLMGPLAGIGDSLIVGTLIPILLGIALGLAEGGSVVGPIFYIIVWNLIITFFQKWIYRKGYELGGSAVEVIVGEQATALRESVIVMGQVVVGAMAASWIGIQTKIQITTDSAGEPVWLQSKLDGALPKLLPLCFVLLCWWLMAKKGVSAIKVLLLMIVVGIVGALIGFFGAPIAE